MLLLPRLVATNMSDGYQSSRLNSSRDTPHLSEMQSRALYKGTPDKGTCPLKTHKFSWHDFEGTVYLDLTVIKAHCAFEWAHSSSRMFVILHPRKRHKFTVYSLERDNYHKCPSRTVPCFHNGDTERCPLSEVNRRSARLVLGWGTSRLSFLVCRMGFGGLRFRMPILCKHRLTRHKRAKCGALPPAGRVSVTPSSLLRNRRRV